MGERSGEGGVFEPCRKHWKNVGFEQPPGGALCEIHVGVHVRHLWFPHGFISQTPDSKRIYKNRGEMKKFLQKHIVCSRGNSISWKSLSNHCKPLAKMTRDSWKIANRLLFATRKCIKSMIPDEINVRATCNSKRKLET